MALIVPDLGLLFIMAPHTGCTAIGEVLRERFGATFVPPEDGESEEDPETKTCSVSVAFTRSRSGTLDPAFTEGGSITATQRRSLSLTLKP